MAGFRRLFIANRGEVAVRILRACDALGVTPVLGVSEADRAAPYVDGREFVVLGGARSSDSYLAMDRVVAAARDSECSALHPGWGFLAENARFATLCEQHGVSFIGPPAHVMQLMGSKTPAKRAMKAAGIVVIDGSDGPVADLEQARSVAAQVGYPVLLKAESGGGGRGMRVATSDADLEAAFHDAGAEAAAAFGDPRLYLERLIVGGRHIEVQILADKYGHAIHLGERDCTVQRKHQKLIEESPAPLLDEAERSRTLRACVQAAQAIGYVGAGTMEFLLAEGRLHFMEMNTRLQVEHCVTEMRSGVDLVQEQIRIAAGHRLALQQDQIELSGHAIECRINAEDPSDGFRPAPGTITTFRRPLADDPDVRVDTHVASGYTVPPHYDSLICKLICRGPDRDSACDKMLAALADFRCAGVPTTAPMHQAIIASKPFRAIDYDTRAIPGWSSA